MAERYVETPAELNSNPRKLTVTSFWRMYQGVELLRGHGGNAYTYTTARVEIDADGAPNAYHPGDTGLDALANAGYPNGSWQSVLVADPQHLALPYVQTTGPFAGYYVSRTSLQDKTREETDVARYVDATSVPYIVFPGAFYGIAGTGGYGDFLMCRNLHSGEEASAIVADGGPTDAPLGEISIALATNLGGRNPNPRTGAGKPRGALQYVIFPRSHATPKWPLTVLQIEAKARALLADAGGWPAFD